MAGASGIRAGRVFIELGADNKISKALAKAKDQLNDFANGVKSVGIGLAGIGTGVLTAFGAAAQTFNSMGSALADASARTGASVEALSELGYAAGLSGSNMETLEKGLRNMGKVTTNAAKGNKAAAATLAGLGVSMSQLAGLSPEDQFSVMADALAGIEDPAAKATAAMSVFGRGGTELLPMLAGGSAGLADMRAQAAALGLTVTGDAAASADKLGDTLDTLWAALKQVAFTIGEAVAPLITELAADITGVVTSVIKWAKANKPLIVMVMKIAAGVAAAGVAIIAIGYAISALAGIIGAIGTVFGVVMTVIGVLKVAFLALISPIGLVIAGVLLIVGTILYFSGAAGKALSFITEKFAELKAWVGEVVGGISDAIAAGDIQLAAKILWLGLQVVWQAGSLAVVRIWRKAKDMVIKAGYDIYFGVLSAWTLLQQGIINSVIAAASTVIRVWTKMVSEIRAMQAGLMDLVENRNVASKATMGVLASGGNPVLAGIAVIRGVNEARKLDTNGKQKAIEDTLKKDLADQEKFAKDWANAANKESSDRLAKIGQESLDAEKAINDATAAAIGAREADLDATKKELEDAIAAAAQAKALLTSPLPRSARTAGAAAAAAESASRVIGYSTRGTFNAAAAQGLAAGGSAFDAIAKATQETAKNTAKLVKGQGDDVVEFD